MAARRPAGRQPTVSRRSAGRPGRRSARAAGRQPSCSPGDAGRRELARRVAGARTTRRPGRRSSGGAVGVGVTAVQPEADPRPTPSDVPRPDHPTVALRSHAEHPGVRGARPTGRLRDLWTTRSARRPETVARCPRRTPASSAAAIGQNRAVAQAPAESLSPDAQDGRDRGPRRPGTAVRPTPRDPAQRVTGRAGPVGGLGRGRRSVPRTAGVGGRRGDRGRRRRRSVAGRRRPSPSAVAERCRAVAEHWRAGRR